MARILDLVPATFRQLIPLNGIFVDGWHPSTAVALYWFESVLLAVIAVVLCWRFERRAADAEEREAAKEAGIDPRAVAVFHIGSLAVFGGFLGGILLILTGNKHLPPFNWAEFRDGADAMMLVIAVSFAYEMLSFRSMGMAAVQSRVNACLGRWALLWLLGFVGTVLLVLTGRPIAFIGWFAILKAVWEVWGTLARVFGWTSLQERAAAQSQSES
jgi:hypothetical protein